MNQKISKEELKSPDAFQAVSEKVVNWIGKNSKPIMATAIVIVIGSVAWVGYDWLQKKNEQQAQEALFRVESKLEKLIQDKETAKEAKVADKKSKAPGKEEKKPEDLKDFSDVIAGYREVIKNHRGTYGAIIAAMELSDLFLEYKDYQGSLDALNSVVNDLKENHLFYGLVHNLMGTIYTHLNDLPKAAAEYKKVSESKAQEHLRPEALLNLGLIHEKLGEFEKAKSYYEEVNEAYAFSDAAWAAKQYLRLLKLNQAGG